MVDYKRVILIAVCVAIAIFSYKAWFKKPRTSEEMPNVDMLSTETGLSITELANVNYYGQAKGYYAAPADGKTYPGVVMIHEWWGLNDHIKDMAKELAKQGYQVLAVDMYNGEVAGTPERARELTTAVRGNVEEANKNLKAAAAYLRGQNATKIASLGWCFGGGQSLNLALSGEKLDATVIYYGTLVTDKEKLAAISWPVLGVFGGTDASIPVEQVNAFDKALDDLNVENSINIYPGVGHAFANPSGANYAPNETKDAWEKTLSFLAENLK